MAAGICRVGTLSHNSVVKHGESMESVDPLVGGSRVDHLESFTGALVKDGLGFEALVLVISVGAHALTEAFEVERTDLGQDVNTG